MSKLVVIGGQKLSGELVVEGSKNAVLPILAATVLNGGINVIKNCPSLKDVEIMLDILRKIGCNVKEESDAIIIDSSTVNSTEIPEDLAVEMRSSIILLGAMLARFGKVTISHPGGCVGILASKGTVPFDSFFNKLILRQGEPSPCRKILNCYLNALRCSTRSIAPSTT